MRIGASLDEPYPDLVNHDHWPWIKSRGELPAEPQVVSEVQYFGPTGAVLDEDSLEGLSLLADLR